MSDRSQNQSSAVRPRVLKPHQAEGLRPLFEIAESFGSSPAAALIEPADGEEGALPPLPAALPPEAAYRWTDPVDEAESRARAIERRAEAVLAEAEETVAERLAEAEAKVQELLAEVEAGVESLRVQAREEGRLEGRTEGYVAGRAEAEGLILQAQAEAEALLTEARQQAETIHQEAMEQRSLLLDASMEQVLDLAFIMARHVLKTELTLRPTAMLPMLVAALAKLKGEEEPYVRVSPEVISLLEGHRGRLLTALPGARSLLLESDPSMEPGDFAIQGGQGLVDGRLDRQVAVLEEQLRLEERRL